MKKKKEIVMLKANGLFATKNSIEEAFQYADDIIGTLREEDRVTAYTAMYVLYNSVVKEANKGVVHADNW